MTTTLRQVNRMRGTFTHPSATPDHVPADWWPDETTYVHRPHLTDAATLHRLVRDMAELSRDLQVPWHLTSK